MGLELAGWRATRENPHLSGCVARAPSAGAIASAWRSHRRNAAPILHVVAAQHGRQALGQRAGERQDPFDRLLVGIGRAGLDRFRQVIVPFRPAQGRADVVDAEEADHVVDRGAVGRRRIAELGFGRTAPERAQVVAHDR